jgi:hypothetical protein
MKRFSYSPWRFTCVFFKVLSDHMRKLPRSAASEKLRERVVYIDILKQQMLDLEAVRKELAQAESRAAALKRSGRISGTSHYRFA